jgi:hypothetical protein
MVHGVQQQVFSFRPAERLARGMAGRNAGLVLASDRREFLTRALGAA